jgi:hypothetical protein
MASEIRDRRWSDSRRIGLECLGPTVSIPRCDQSESKSSDDSLEVADLANRFAGIDLVLYRLRKGCQVVFAIFLRQNGNQVAFEALDF